MRTREIQVMPEHRCNPLDHAGDPRSPSAPAEAIALMQEGIRRLILCGSFNLEQGNAVVGELAVQLRTGRQY